MYSVRSHIVHSVPHLSVLKKILSFELITVIILKPECVVNLL